MFSWLATTFGHAFPSSLSKIVKGFPGLALGHAFPSSLLEIVKGFPGLTLGHQSHMGRVEAHTPTPTPHTSQLRVITNNNLPWESEQAWSNWPDNVSAFIFNCDFFYS